MVAPVLLNVTVLVPSDDKPDKAVALVSCNVALVTAILEVLPAVLVVWKYPGNKTVPLVILKVALSASVLATCDVRVMFPLSVRFVTDELSASVYG